MSHFIYPDAAYDRKVDILSASIEQSATYLHQLRNIPYETAHRFVHDRVYGLNGQQQLLKERRVCALVRGKNGDREKKDIPFREYHAKILEKKIILSPSLTGYLSPDVKESLLAVFAQGNMDRRGTLKKLKFKYKMAKDAARANYYDGLQESVKILNNSLSGAHANDSTPLANKSSHPTLTSTCRTSSSYANANNEMLLAGNRHFWCPAVVTACMINASVYTDFDALHAAIDKYNLYLPTPDDVVACIRRSSRYYFRGDKYMDHFREHADRMTGVQRAAFVYIGDMYHLKEHNPQVVRDFLSALSTPAAIPVNNTEALIKEHKGDALTLAMMLLSDRIQGIQLEDLETKNPELYGLLGGTIQNIANTIDDFQTLIKGVFRPTTLPTSIAILPTIIREVVMTSDTDSTIFTNQYWADWMTGSEDFSIEGYRTAYATTFLASQTVRHKLGLMSANLGIVKRHMHRISMKNEYFFPVYSLTPVAKHYYALRSIQEGNVLPELELEIKGVHLRDSSAPPIVTKKLHKYIRWILEGIMDNKRFSSQEILTPVVELEQDIVTSMEKGETRYMRAVQIKDSSSYADEEEANLYKNHLFWNEVFGPSYGEAPPLPYYATKVSVELPNRTRLREWVEDLQDKDLADRFRKWLVKSGKTSIETFYVPQTVIEARGVPTPMCDAMHYRKAAMGITRPFYLVMASLGLYCEDDKYRRMISDTFRTYGHAA